ncbi:MAG: hypothetical protein MUP26_06015, partial [Desulfobulbaceae bacterium]|nr:hypothetical protein [Desulfobulbaceae bacterium]
MNGKTRRTVGHFFCALIIISSFFLWGCTTPERTQDEKAPGTPVLETISLTPEGDRSVIAITSSTETIFSPFFTLPSPPRICLDIKGIPGSAFSKAVTAESGPVRDVPIQDRGSGYTGLVLYLRQEGSECAVTTEGTLTRIVIGPAGAARPAAIQEGAAAPKVSSLPQILNVEVSEPRKNKTRLTIFCEKELPYQVKLNNKTLTLDLKDSSISASLIKKLDAQAFEGAVESIKVVQPRGVPDVSLIIILRELAPYHISREGPALHLDFASFPKSAVRVSEPSSQKTA